MTSKSDVPIDGRSGIFGAHDSTAHDNTGLVAADFNFTRARRAAAPHSSDSASNDGVDSIDSEFSKLFKSSKCPMKLIFK